MPADLLCCNVVFVGVLLEFCVRISYAFVFQLSVFYIVGEFVFGEV